MAPSQPEIVMEQLRAGARQLGLDLTPDQVMQFERYYQLLVAWNERINLTAITGYGEVQVKHYLDSLASLPLIAEELKLQLPFPKPLQLVDVGTGAGFPGLPLKIAVPSLLLTLMDGTHKKIDFLQATVQALAVTAVEFVTGRAEELGRLPAYRERYDLVTARAVAPLNTLVEYLLPLTRVNGLVVIYKGPSAAEEFVAARPAIKLLGGDTVRLAPVTVPFLDERRFLLLIRKVQPTSRQYPRGQGLARKRPLG